MKIKSLYIHIPFCDHICIYCDFYKMISEKEKIKEYFKYLIKEVDLKKQYFSDLETIYVGGGTPSSIDISILDNFFHYLSKNINLKNIKEFTFECNPKDINDNLINLFLKYNINRISLGAQSLNNEKLQFLNRNHSDKDIIEAINLLHFHNIYNINCDIIYGLSTDNINLIKSDLEKLYSMNIKHISCYTLIIENKSILNHYIKKYNYKPLPDDSESEINDFINKFMKQNGYKHYEISNYAIPGYESIHNLTYWNMDYYVGIGANASYFIDNTRYTNINNLSKYYLGIDNCDLSYKEKINLSEIDLKYDFLMLGLRKLDGINVFEYNNRFNDNILNYNSVKKYINNKIMKLNNNHLSINEEYIYVSNEIIINIVGEFYE